MADISTWIATLWSVVWGALSWVYWTVDTLIFSLPILGPFIEVAVWIGLAVAAYRYAPHWLRPAFTWIAAKLRWIFGPVLDFIWQPIQRAMIRRATGVDVGASETEKDQLIQKLQRQVRDLESQNASLKARRSGAKTKNKLTLSARVKWMGIGGVLVGTSRWWGPVVWPYIQKIPSMVG